MFPRSRLNDQLGAGFLIYEYILSKKGGFEVYFVADCLKQGVHESIKKNLEGSGSFFLELGHGDDRQDQKC